MKKLLLVIAMALCMTRGFVFAAGLPTPQDVEDQLKKLYPNEHGAEMFPRGSQFEVLFLSPDHPTSCLVDVATHRVTNCHFDDVEPEKCACVRAGNGTQCNNACMQPASPDVVAALRKRYPDLQEDEVDVFDDGSHHYEVVFYITQSHLSCRLDLNPIRFSHCHPIHA